MSQEEENTAETEGDNVRALRRGRTGEDDRRVEQECTKCIAIDDTTLRVESLRLGSTHQCSITTNVSLAQPDHSLQTSTRYQRELLHLAGIPICASNFTTRRAHRAGQALQTVCLEKNERAAF